MSAVSTFQVLQFADRLLMVNHTHQTVTIYGYDGEPYARVLADGTAEQNTRSPATYLNKSFYGDINVPPQADPKASPRWEVIDRTGQLEWHDHRIHYTSPVVPPQVKDKSKRSLIFDWKIPITVGSQKGDIAGQLFWTPESSKASTTVIVIGVAIVLLGLAFVVVVRMRRRRDPLDTPPARARLRRKRGERAIDFPGDDAAGLPDPLVHLAALRGARARSRRLGLVELQADGPQTRLIGAPRRRRRRLNRGFPTRTLRVFPGRADGSSADLHQKFSLLAFSSRVFR